MWFITEINSNSNMCRTELVVLSWFTVTDNKANMEVVHALFCRTPPQPGVLFSLEGPGIR